VFPGVGCGINLNKNKIKIKCFFCGFVVLDLWLLFGCLRSFGVLGVLGLSFVGFLVFRFSGFSRCLGWCNAFWVFSLQCGFCGFGFLASFWFCDYVVCGFCFVWLVWCILIFVGAWWFGCFLGYLANFGVFVFA